MKNKSMLAILSLSFILLGCGIRHAEVYIERHPTVVVEEPATEVVIINGCPVRRVIVAPRRPIVIRHRHH